MHNLAYSRLAQAPSDNGNPQFAPPPQASWCSSLHCMDPISNIYVVFRAAPSPRLKVKICPAASSHVEPLSFAAALIDEPTLVGNV